MGRSQILERQIALECPTVVGRRKPVFSRYARSASDTISHILSRRGSRFFAGPLLPFPVQPADPAALVIKAIANQILSIQPVPRSADALNYTDSGMIPADRLLRLPRSEPQ